MEPELLCCLDYSIPALKTQQNLYFVAFLGVEYLPSPLPALDPVLGFYAQG